ADIADARLELSESHSDRAIPIMQTTGQAGRRWRKYLTAATLAVLVIIAGVLAMLRLTRAPPERPLRLAVRLAPDVSLASLDRGASVVLSPNGRTLVFVGKPDGGTTRLFLRKLDQTEVRPLNGTDEAASPFFSPDGQWIGFFADGKLKKVSVLGGA